MKSKIFQEVIDETPEETKIFVRLYADLAVRINQVMRDKGYSQNMLAEKLDKRPSEISKWLNGEHNFTLRSIAKLQAELGETLLEIPVQRPMPEINENVSVTRYTMTVYRSKSNPNEDIEWKRASIKTDYNNVG
ncbi:MAG: helix-turn-helix transcriptional regulator [Bacteroidales bacterium]|nr:helix-turn-helix transcriptional regulator [Bacteroidales bacterium]